MESPELDEELKYKVLVIGDIGTGKTSFISRWVHGVFDKAVTSTVTVDFAVKEVLLDPHQTMVLHLWDIAGQERFSHLTHVYYKNAQAALILFDLTSRRTFEGVKKWKRDLERVLPVDMPVVLLGNKADLQFRQGQRDEIDALCRELQLSNWIETSAKDGTNIDAVGAYLSRALAKLEPNEREERNAGDVRVRLSRAGDRTSQKRSSCCSKA
eukprot:TRINITY_DN227_c0_g1_i7.p1 TRINITY_DN227_c0_g1~~TRINITY_DN227_c0_g1_i7.p1  ORF type:complete len:212 (+),score=11.81 TRINITY_DN227_c0_g1_i7:93-728(+)